MSQKEKDSHPLYQQDQKLPPGAVIVKRQKPPPRPRADRPLLTYALMALNGLIFLAGFLLPELEWQLFLGGALIPQLVVEELQVYRLFTAMFLHGSLGHIFFNVYALFIVGREVEPIFGRLRFWLIYLLGGLTGSALSLALGGLSGASVGASGAVFAIFAAQAVHLRQHRGVYVNAQARLRHMAFLIGINLVLGFMPGSRIDNWGHIGGMLGGALLAWRIGPILPRPTAPPRSLREFARLDSNPLRLRLPELLLYSGGLVVLVALAIALHSLSAA